jgi:hypothetical protein
VQEIHNVKAVSIVNPQGCIDDIERAGIGLYPSPGRGPVAPLQVSMEGGTISTIAISSREYLWNQY